MQAKLFEIATRIGTPLALAGLVVGVMYLLYKSLLEGRLLSSISPGHSYRIINRIINFVFILSVIALALGVACYVLTVMIPQRRTTSALEFTDLAVILRPSFPILDMKFRNLGSDVAYIKNVSIEVLGKNIQKENKGFSAMPSTWQYNLLIDPHSNQQTFDVPVSQVVPSNGTDRFSVVVGQMSRYGEIRYTDYRLRVRVFYNANEASQAKDISVRVISPPNFAKPGDTIGFTSGERLAALDSPDFRTVAEMATVLGALGEQGAIARLESILSKEPEPYIEHYKGEFLGKGVSELYLETNSRMNLRQMYASAFWAIKQLTGDYHDSLLDAMPRRWRPTGVMALDIAKQTAIELARCKLQPDKCGEWPQQ